MNFPFSYLGRSGLSGQTLNFAPNLSREPVAFDATLRRPQRFREAISALHDVVVSDLRFKKRDKSAYEAWKEAETQRVRTPVSSHHGWQSLRMAVWGSLTQAISSP